MLAVDEMFCIDTPKCCDMEDMSSCCCGCPRIEEMPFYKLALPEIGSLVSWTCWVSVTVNHSGVGAGQPRSIKTQRLGDLIPLYPTSCEHFSVVDR